MFHSLSKLNKIINSVFLHNNLKNVVNIAANGSCKLHTSNVQYMFHFKDKKGGYKTENVHISNYEHLKNGFKMLKGEIKLWTEEVKENFSISPTMLYRPYETDVVWYLDNEETLNQFITTADSDHSEGFSTCSLTLSKSGRGLFSGHLETRIPKDGRIQKAGYCAVRSVRVMKSFGREWHHDWALYNTLVLKVRGDGRSYMINLSTEGFFDINWYDMYNYVLYTRGGPYWQIAKIPFSKFILSTRGRVQDKQYRIPSCRITHFGITCSDKIEGEFNLEIEYIGLESNPDHEEDFAYEMYQTDKNVSSH